MTWYVKAYCIGLFETESDNLVQSFILMYIFYRSSETIHFPELCFKLTQANYELLDDNCGPGLGSVAMSGQLDGTPFVLGVLLYELPDICHHLIR